MKDQEQKLTDREKKIKSQLKSTLPYGSGAEIKRRVEVNYKRVLSSSMIGNVLNPDKELWDDDVISTALDLAKEKLEKRELIDVKSASLEFL